MRKTEVKLLGLLLFFSMAVTNVNSQKVSSSDLINKAKFLRSFSIEEKDWRFPFFSANSKLLAVRSKNDRHTTIWNVSLGTTELSINPCDGQGYGTSFGLLDKLIIVNCLQGKGEIWGIKEARKLKNFQTSFENKTEITALWLSPNGENVVLKNSYGKLTELWNVENTRKTANLNGSLMEGTPTSDAIAFSPDSKTVAISYIAIDRAFSVQIYLWDVKTGKLKHLFIDQSLEKGMSRSHNSVVHDLAFTPDGRYLISGSYDTTAKVWDVKTGKLIYTLSGHKHRIQEIAVSSDRQKLATGSYDETAKIWDLNTGKLLWTTPKQGKEVWRLSFSPDGKKLYTGTDDRFYIWDLDKRDIIGKVSVYFTKTAFSSDWKYFVLPGKNKTSIDVYELIE